jgi:hypothetical protein
MGWRCWCWEVAQEDAVSFLEARVWRSDATIVVLSGYRGPIFFRFRFFCL